VDIIAFFQAHHTLTYPVLPEYILIVVQAQQVEWLHSMIMNYIIKRKFNVYL